MANIVIGKTYKNICQCGCADTTPFVTVVSQSDYKNLYRGEEGGLYAARMLAEVKSTETDTEYEELLV